MITWNMFKKVILGMTLPEDGYEEHHPKAPKRVRGYSKRECGCIVYDNWHLGAEPCFWHSERPLVVGIFLFWFGIAAIAVIIKTIRG